MTQNYSELTVRVTICQAAKNPSYPVICKSNRCKLFTNIRCQGMASKSTLQVLRFKCGLNTSLVQILNFKLELMQFTRTACSPH